MDHRLARSLCGSPAVRRCVRPAGGRERQVLMLSREDAGPRGSNTCRCWNAHSWDLGKNINSICTLVLVWLVENHFLVMLGGFDESIYRHTQVDFRAVEDPRLVCPCVARSLRLSSLTTRIYTILYTKRQVCEVNAEQNHETKWKQNKQIQANQQ